MPGLAFSWPADRIDDGLLVFSTGQEILEARDQIAAGARLGPTILAAKSLIGASENVSTPPATAPVMMRRE